MSQKEVTAAYKTFVKQGIIFVPHYTKTTWVSPNYNKTLKEYTEKELEDMNAKPWTEMLWERKGHKIIV